MIPRGGGFVSAYRRQNVTDQVKLQNLGNLGDLWRKSAAFMFHSLILNRATRIVNPCRVTDQEMMQKWSKMDIVR